MEISRKDILLTLINLALGVFIGLIIDKPKTNTITRTETKEKVVYRDTVVRRSYTMPSVPKLIIFPPDTIVRNNTVYIKDSTSTYTFNDDDYNLEIQAVRLQDYKLYLHIKETVPVSTTTITNTTKIKNQSRISLGVTFGMGATYDLVNKNMAFGPSAVAGLQIKF